MTVYATACPLLTRLQSRLKLAREGLVSQGSAAILTGQDTTRSHPRPLRQPGATGHSDSTITKHTGQLLFQRSSTSCCRTSSFGDRGEREGYNACADDGGLEKSSGRLRHAKVPSVRKRQMWGERKRERGVHSYLNRLRFTRRKNESLQFLFD